MAQDETSGDHRINDSGAFYGRVTVIKVRGLLRSLGLSDPFRVWQQSVRSWTHSQPWSCAASGTVVDLLFGPFCLIFIHLSGFTWEGSERWFPQGEAELLLKQHHELPECEAESEHNYFWEFKDFISSLFFGEATVTAGSVATCCVFGHTTYKLTI